MLKYYNDVAANTHTEFKARRRRQVKVGLTRLASLRLQPKTSALLLILVLIVTLTSCTKPTSRIPADEAEKISIAVTPWPASAAVYVAHEKGYFRDEGLQETLREYPSGHLGLADLLMSPHAEIRRSPVPPSMANRPWLSPRYPRLTGRS